MWDQRIHVSCFIVIFALLQWSGTEPATALRYACIYHNFSICSSTDGHLICLHVLLIVNNASKNTRVHISFLASGLGIFFFLDKYAREEYLGHMVVLFFNFLSKLHTVFHSAWANLQSCQQDTVFSFLHILTNTVISYLFTNCHSNSVRGTWWATVHGVTRSQKWLSY